MRILVTVPWGDRLGGAEAMLQAIVDGSKESGHEVELVFFEHGTWPHELLQAGFRVDVLAAGRLRQAHRTVATVLRLARIMRRRKPDLILNWSAKTQLYGSPAAVLAGMRGRVLWWQQAIPSSKGWLDRTATLLPAIAVGCYSGPAAQAQQQLFPGRRTFVVGAGAPVPSAREQEPPLRLPPGVPVVGLVGRLQPWKGQDRLLEAQALLRDRGYPLHSVIIGGDSWDLSPEYAASLPRLVDRLALGEHVTMTGEVPDAGPYVEQMDILVNASDPEPFGIVLLEAMARGVAVVAVDSGGPGEFIDNGRTGMLARSGAPDALADALQPLLSDAELRRAVARAGHESFLRDFTDAALRERFFASLRSLLAGTRADAPGA
jgi:glycosyltransferase involved in cell wall biosynthesis